MEGGEGGRVPAAPSDAPGGAGRDEEQAAGGENSGTAALGGTNGNGHTSPAALGAALQAAEADPPPGVPVGPEGEAEDAGGAQGPSGPRGAQDGQETPSVRPGAEPPPLSPALAGALRGALAGLAADDGAGEDDLDAFPPSPEARAAEIRRIELAATGPLPPAEPAPVPPSALASMVPAVVAAPPKVAPRPPVVVDEAIRRFHREIGLIRDEDEPAAAGGDAAASADVAALSGGEVALVPAGEGADLPVDSVAVEVLPAPDGAGGGSDDGGGPSPPDGGESDGGDGNGGGGRRRRAAFWAVEDRPMTVFEHLDELRTRLVWSAAAFIIGTAVAFPFAGRILRYTQTNAESFIHRMGSKNIQITIIAGSPMGALFSWIEFAMVLGLFLSGAVILYEIVAYVMPALTKRERGVLFSYLPPAMGLFLVGICFGVFVFQPVAMRVATTFLSWIQPTYTIAEWNDFVIKYSLYFGMLYELPVIVGIVVRLGFLTPETLSKGRRWAFMGSLVIALMFAPPADFIFTPSLICLPLYGLFEVSIIVARVVYRARLRDLEAEEM